jgi:hypothetical protein
MPLTIASRDESRLQGHVIYDTSDVLLGLIDRTQKQAGR